MLKAVIARLIGFITKPTDIAVQPTQTVGPVSQVHTAPSGNKPTVRNIKSQSVKRKPRQSKKAAPKATQGKSSKQEQKPVRKASGQKQRKTRV